MTNPAPELTRAEEAQAIALIPAMFEELRELRAELAALRTPAPEEPSLLTVREFSARAGISQCTCRRRVADGTLPHVRLAGSIRIPASSLRPTDPETVARLVREARGQ